MKIFPQKHSILQTSQVNSNTDIPLAYIGTDEKDYSCEIEPVMESFSPKVLLPYHEFDSYNVALFRKIGNDFTKIDSSNLLQRIGDKYQYIPDGVISYIPMSFNYMPIIKKNIRYTNNRNYDFKVLVTQDFVDESLDSDLFKVFGDASSRGLCPENISVNNKDLSMFELYNYDSMYSDGKELPNFPDFIFTHDNGKTPMSNNYVELMDSTICNVWVALEEMPFSITEGNVSLKNNVFYSDTATKTNSFVSGDFNNFFGISNSEDIINHNIFAGNTTVAVIKEIVGRGFLIFTTKDFIRNIDKNVKLFYEIMMYTYSKGYLIEGPFEKWITDDVPDYIVMNNELVPMDDFRSHKPLYEISRLQKGEAEISEVLLSSGGITYSMDKNDYIVFKKEKQKEYADPKKPEGAISVYTPNKDIVYFKDLVYELADDARDRITAERVKDSYEIKVRSYKNTKANLDIRESPVNDIKIPLTYTQNYQEISIESSEFYILTRAGIIDMVDTNIYEDYMGIILAKVHIKRVNDATAIYDMRRRGGGLPKNEEPDGKSLLDLSYIKGTAYRKSGGLVIRMPKKYEEHKELIMDTIKKHIVAEKYPLLVFEDEEGIL